MDGLIELEMKMNLKNPYTNIKNFGNINYQELKILLGKVMMINAKGGKKKGDKGSRMF